MLKGTTTIELTNVKTGQVQKIVHENMVTNCVNDMLKNTGLHPAPATFHAYTLNNNIAEDLFGGIFLWKNRLNEDATDYIIPADNECVGYGCSLGNNTDNDKMGSYNPSESGQLENGYRHVWDFTTNQGNGEISAVSLVPKITGQLGLGLSVDKVNTSLYPSSWRSFCEMRNSSYKLTNSVACYPYLYVKDDYIYGVKRWNLQYNGSYVSDHVSRNGKKLIIQKIRFSRNKIHLKDAVYSHSFVEEEIEVQLPDELTVSTTGTSWFGFCNYDDGYIYLSLSNAYSSKDINIQICKINIDTYACEVIPINIKDAFPYNCYFLGTSAVLSETSIGASYHAGVYNNKFITVAPPYSSSSAWCTGYVDLSAPTVFQKFKNPDDTNTTFSNMYAYIGKYMYISGTPIRMLNLEDDTCSFINATAVLLQGICSITEVYSGYGHILQTVRNADDPNETYLYLKRADRDVSTGIFVRNHLPHVMTTKNNLDVAVTKTDGQTMKVTYVLTEV